jgi:CheY-like chemotaxis protein
MSAESKGPIVLLAEDSEDDAFFFRWTLKKTGIKCELVHATDGLHAVRILERCVGPDGKRRVGCPDLVFLDLKMPALTGFEVLEWIRQHPFEPPLDVAVLSGSEHAIDIERAKSLGATGYYVKPISADTLRARFEGWSNRSSAPQPVANSPTK